MSIFSIRSFDQCELFCCFSLHCSLGRGRMGTIIFRLPLLGDFFAAAREGGRATGRWVIFVMGLALGVLVVRQMDDC